VAVLRDRAVVSRRRHDDGLDYSAWLLPAVAEALVDAGTKMEQLDLLAAATGPGSFTGLRVGLTTVKAWAEVYDKHIVGVSRLEAMARAAETTTEFVASCYDAQRGQLFGGLYRSSNGGLIRVGDELVIAPEGFVELVDKETGRERVTWIALDPELIQQVISLQRRLAVGDRLVVGSTEVAPAIAVLAEERAARGEFSDPVFLDANYVRRSDAEILWKGAPAGVR
jgi:tRNA threonylcarbamoyladenosine biosynthesis protein TsaB